MRKYKMIVLDLDDTLLLDDGTISKRTKESLQIAQQQGVKVVLASGRPTYAIHKIAEELELKKYGGYIISFNGARIIDCQTNETLYEANLKREQVKMLYEFCEKHKAFFHTYVENDIIASEKNKYTDVEKDITGMEIFYPNDFVNTIPDEVVKVIVLQNPEYLKELEQKLKPIIGNSMYMTISKPFFLEFMNKNVDKSQSIIRLTRLLGLKTNETVAIGDSYNDISMIKVAGLGIAMQNSVEEVKKVADYITESNVNDGVAKAIIKFILPDYKVNKQTYFGGTYDL